MANKNSGKLSGEPPQDKKQDFDTSNLIPTRTPAKGSAYEQALSPDTEDFNTPSFNSLKPQKGIEPRLKEDEAIAFVQRVAGVDKETAKKMNDAVWAYTGYYYDAIRAVQQGKSNNAKMKEHAENLERYIERAAKWGGGTTYRGIRAGGDYKPGDIIDQCGTSSWSTELSIAKSFSFGGKNKTIFISPTQSKGTSTGFSHQHHAEMEVTVSQKARYVAERVEKHGDYTYVWVRET